MKPMRNQFSERELLSLAAFFHANNLHFRWIGREFEHGLQAHAARRSSIARHNRNLGEIHNPLVHHFRDRRPLGTKR